MPERTEDLLRQLVRLLAGRPPMAPGEIGMLLWPDETPGRSYRIINGKVLPAVKLLNEAIRRGLVEKVHDGSRREAGRGGRFRLTGR